MSVHDNFSVEYDHERNRRFHTVRGAVEVLQSLFPNTFPKSVLDVGCGTGTWLRAALDCGATKVLGIDGIDLEAQNLHVPKSLLRRADLSQTLDLQQRFELVLCLETAEHLEPDYAPMIVESLTRHGDTILFSAAAPGQPGTHHVNCQWPDFWQQLFNERGFACNDEVRWLIWDNAAVEPWYRQNLILASRDQARAGREHRLRRVVHPEMLTYYAWSFFEENVRRVEDGALPIKWYAHLPLKALLSKLRRLNIRHTKAKD